jgi:hypothetical protein
MVAEDPKSKTEAPAGPLDLPADKAHCESNAACEKLLADAAPSVFKVHGDHEEGTGWIGPDGRLITNYHVIMGNREITAEDGNGNIYRLGKDVAIDDINDLAALSFVDGPPKGAVPLKLDTDMPKAGDPATILSHRLGHSLEMSQGDFNRPRKMAEGFGNVSPQESKSVLEKWRSSPDLIDREKAALLDRTVFEYKIGGDHGSSGAPIFDKDGRVQSVMERTGVEDKHPWAIPATSVADLLSQTPSQRKFDVKTGYETGVSNYFHRLGQESNLHATIDAGLPLMGALTLSRIANGSGGKLNLGLATAFLAGQTISDGRGMIKSTNWRDAIANTTATAGDAAMIAGTAARFIPKSGTVSLALMGAGAAVRLGAELIPNRYTIQEIRRTDKDPHKPLFDELYGRH